MTELSFTAAVLATIKGEAMARGISLRDLSVASGFGKETIRGYIHRRRPIDTDKLDAIAGGLGMSIDDFLDLVLLRRQQSRTK